MSENLNVVHGTVTGANGTPLGAAAVTVFRQGIREQTSLASTKVGADGTYQATYHPPVQAAELLIVVRATSPDLDAPVESPPTPTEPDLQIDLAAQPSDASEYHRLLEAMTPLLDGLAVTDLVENDAHQDLSFLAQETSRDTEDLMRAAVAGRLEAASQIPAAVFYAFLRQQMPATLPSPLVEASDGFALIDGLVSRIASLTAALPGDVAKQALEAAISGGIIGPQFTAQIPDIVAALRTRHTADMLSQPYRTGKATLAQLLDVTQLPQDKQQLFAGALADNGQPISEFWTMLEDGQHGLTADEAAAVERALSVGALINNHVPLLKLLLDGFTAGTYRALPDLARLNQDDWLALVQQAGPPANIDPSGTASAAEVFAKEVYAQLGRAYPTAALSTLVVSGDQLPQEQRAAVAQFFRNNSTLDLMTQNLTAFIDEAGDAAFTGIDGSDRTAVVSVARRLQRVLRLAPSADTAQSLLRVGIDSAVKIASMGRQRFVSAAVQAGLTDSAAATVYDSATHRYASVLSLYARFNRGAIGVWPRAVGDVTAMDGAIEAAVARDESLATLFGSQDYCATDFSTSILSPAAYLCDLLMWLGKRQVGTGTALDVLDARRPDIRHLLLNQANTEAPLPYIDLVNEILADAISTPAGLDSATNPPWKQTSLDKTAAELRAAPEYFNQGAYAALAEASYPHTLPYSAGLDGLRSVLAQANVPLWQVRQALLPLHPASPAVGVTQQAPMAAERLAMSPREQALVTIPDLVAADTAWNVASAASSMSSVPAFLSAAGISYESMLELLQVAWVQGGLGVTIEGATDTCDTSAQTLAPAPLDAGFLDRAHRFLRLWRRIGVKMWELDLLLRAPGVADDVLDESGLAAVQSFWELQNTTQLTVDQLLAFFQNIDTASHRDPDGSATASLYARTFLNPAVVSVAPDPDLVALPLGGAVQKPELSDHLPAVQAALAVSATDAAVLFALTDGQLTIENLSAVYRVAVLAGVANLSIPDLFSLASLMDPGATDVAALAATFASPAASLAFLTTAKVVRESGLSIDALTFLLTPPAWATATQLTDADIGAALGAVRAAILSSAGGDADGSVVAATAATAHRPMDTQIANDLTATILRQFTVSGTALLAVLTDASLIAAPGGVFTPLTADNFPDQFLAIRLFDKAAVLVRRLQLVNSDFTWLQGNAAAYGGLDLTALPVTNSQPALTLSSLTTTLMLIQLARLFTLAPAAAEIQTLYDLISGIRSGAVADEPAAQAALAAITRWSPEDIAAFAGAVGAEFPADYQRPALYDTVRRLHALAVAAGGSGRQLVDWGAIPANETAAQAMFTAALGALKARFDDRQWLAVAPGIIDPIRERRSAALQAYLIAQRDGSGDLTYPDSDALFDHFLIDVQMGSCEVSTRVVQAYIAVQIFVERCLMNLEPPVVLTDDDRKDWQRMKRFRIWQAAREVFLYPENWLIESQRPNRTEVFQQLEQAAHQNEATRDYLETTVLDYIDGLDAVANLLVTGTCEEPGTGTVHVVARSTADPPTYYHRSRVDGAWTGWTTIPLDIRAHHAVPAVYRGRLCLFWLGVTVTSEPTQQLPAAQLSSIPPSQDVEKYVTIGIHFSIFRNGKWGPAQVAKDDLYDKPVLTAAKVSDPTSVEALYTLKVQSVGSVPGSGSGLFVDVFRLGTYRLGKEADKNGVTYFPVQTPLNAVHIGRAVFDGRLRGFELRDLPVIVNGTSSQLLGHAQEAYGIHAQALVMLPDAEADPDLRVVAGSGLITQAGALTTPPGQSSGDIFAPLTFSWVPAAGLLNNTLPPFRVVGQATDVLFDQGHDFIFQDSHRSYFVHSAIEYHQVPVYYVQTYELNYEFHRFHHPFTQLFWHQLSSGGFPLLYDRDLQLNPDAVVAGGTDAFSFATYGPTSRVSWDHNEAGEDREFLDFGRGAAYSTYNWELFFHGPLYIAEMLSQNQQFEDAMAWYHYIFDPTKAGDDPAPRRFWIPKPLYDLTTPEILAERINNLLVSLDQGDPDLIGQVNSWIDDPFDPFLIADQRPVAYMKRVVMSYLDNLIAWADNLFATDSREALNEATLLYVIADEILGPQPAAVTPSAHADESFDQLQPDLDTFANAMVEVENLIGVTTDVGDGGADGEDASLPAPHAFYFKIPPNDKLLGYWNTVADRLFKLRHCQNIAGVTRQLALFDPAIDPGLLIRAQAAGVDIGSVLSDVSVALPGYRFTALYPQALDFVNAVRAYGALLLGAVEKSDSASLALLQQTSAQQLLRDGDQILDWQVQQAEQAIEVLEQALALDHGRMDYYQQQAMHLSMNVEDQLGMSLSAFSLILYYAAALGHKAAAAASAIPTANTGVAGAMASLVATLIGGGETVAKPVAQGAEAIKDTAQALDKSAAMMNAVAKFKHTADDWNQKLAETQIDIEKTNAQLASAQLALQIAEQNQANHQEQNDTAQKQIDFLNAKFTNGDLYDWMVGNLSGIYFQSYKLAYRICKQLERTYRFELGIADSSFIQFGHWDSLRKGLLAGEALNHDLRMMQASYLELNRRRFEISRFVSLKALDPTALDQLQNTGVCDFDLTEGLFDHDYPGHYNRRLVRVSLTMSYPNPTKFDNIKATLTLVSNKVRVSTDMGPGLAESPHGSDPRFAYNYAAAPQKIVLGNAQDDPGLFLTAINNNLADQRYLPFENAGAISSWHLEMPAVNNEIVVEDVTDVLIHLYYTALDGGDALTAAVQAENAAHQQG